MHDVMKHLNMSIALPAERLQHGVNIYVLPFHGLMGQSSVNIAMRLCHVSYLRSVEPTACCEQTTITRYNYKCLSILIMFIDK